MSSIVLRKIEIVYLHWSMIPVALVLLALSMRGLSPHEEQVRRLLTPRTLLFLCVYSAIGGFLFFNRAVFTHYMFFWTASERIPGVLWSLGMALLPLVVIFAVRCLKSRDLWTDAGILASLLPAVHSVMAAIYIFLAPCGTE
jgi:hypothetical protein